MSEIIYRLFVCETDKYDWEMVREDNVDNVLDESQYYLLNGYAVRIEEVEE